MRTGLAPRALVLICVRTICFAETGLVGGACAMGALGGAPFHCRGTDSIFSCKSATRCDETMVYSLGSNACNESKDRKEDILLFVL